MRISWVVVALVLAGGNARADVFAFKDIDGFEKCMRLDHLIESVKTDKGVQARILLQPEIQLRCIEAATKLVVQTKDKALALGCIKLVKQLSAPDNALDLIGPLIGLSLPACNDTDVYEVLMGPITRPNDGGGVFAKAKAAIKRCLKDGDFKKDFLDEKGSAEGERAANACQILLEEKLVKACKAKP